MDWIVRFTGILPTSLIASASSSGAGTAKPMRSTLRMTVLRMMRPKNGLLNSISNCRKPAHGLAQMPRPIWNSLNAICTP